MNKSTLYLKAIPGWVYTLLIFGFLYLSGLHTEAIGQVQRMLLATGIIRPNLPENSGPAGNSPDIASALPLPITEAAIANDFLMQDLAGNTVKFSSLKNKVIFLNIWATWCPPCVAEMPGIQSLYEKVGTNKNIAFVMLAVDQNGLDKVKKFIARKGYSFPVYLPAGNIPQAFQTQSIPTTFILSKDGKIAARHEGMADYNSEKVKQYLENLAK